MKHLSRNWSEYNESLAQVTPDEIEVAEWFNPLKSLLTGTTHSILELGCSNGRFLVNIGPLVNGSELVGIDIISCKTPDSVDFVRGDAKELPFADGKFDLVYSIGVMEHFDSSGRATLIEEQIRVLKPGGVLLIVIPNCTPGSLRFAKIKALDLFREIHHEAVTPSQLREALRSRGMDIKFDRYFGSSLHLGTIDFSKLIPLQGSALFSDDYALIAKRGCGS